MKRIFTLIAITFALGFSSVSSVFASLTVTINNRTQAQINANDPVAVCAGSDAFFFWGVTNNPPVLPVSNRMWSGTASAFISDPLTQFISFNCLVPGTYYLTFSAVENGITYSVTQPIVVYSKDPLSLDFPTVSPYSSCEGSSVSLEASGTLYYYWERTTDAQAIGSDPTVEETPPGLGTWTYRVYGYNEGCPTNPEFIEFEIDVEEAATVDAGGPYEACTSLGVALNGSIGGSAVSATWSGGLGTFSNPSDLNATYFPDATEAGTDVTLTLTTDDPAGVCPAVSDNATVTVYEQPIADAGTDGNSCNFNFTLAANASAGTGTWTKTAGSGNATFDNINDPTSGLTVDAYDTYIFTWTEVNGICSDNDDVTVNFYEQPVADAGADDQTCGLSYTMDATASVGTGTWTLQSGPGAANFTDDNIATTYVTVLAYGQYVFRWTEVNGTCSDFDDVTIDFWEIPNADAGTDGNSCSFNFTLNANPSVGTGTWTKTAGSGNATFDNINDPSSGVIVDAYDTYIFTWTEVNGVCSDADDVTVNFYEQPVANAGADDQTCGLSYTMDATASVGTGTWTLQSGPGAANFTDDNIATTDVTVLAYGQYVFRWTEVNGTCSDFDDVTIDFFEQPISDAGPDDETCGVSIGLAAVPSAGLGTWTKISGSGTANFDDVNDPNTNVTVSEYDQYVFRWTEVDGICSDFDEVTIDFWEQPVANAGSDDETCGFNISLAAVPSVGTGTWTLNSGPGAANFDDPNGPATGVTVTAYGTYIFTWTEVNGTCAPSADNVTIDFFEQPTADAGADDETCGVTISLNANPSVGIGTWTLSSGPGTANFSNENSETSSVTVSSYGSYVFRWTEVNGICSDFNEVAIDFLEQPIADAGSDDNSCSFNYNLAANASVGTGTWTKSLGSGNATFDDVNDPSSGVTVDAYDTYVFTWTEVNGICSDNDDVTINFYEQPVAVAGDDDATCGQNITLDATASVGLGTWTQISGSGASIFSNENSATSNVTVNAYGQYVYRWTEVNGACSDFDEVTIDFFEQPVADAGTGGSTCGVNFNLNAVPSAGTGTWTYTGPGTASFNPNENAHDAVVTVDTYGDYTLTWTEVNGICNSDDDILVSFYEQPIANAGPDADNCSLNATLAATPSVGIGTWTLETGPGGAIFDDINSPNSGVTVDAYGAYTFRWTEVNNICNDFDEVTITFFETPTADAGLDGDACGYQYTLSANPSVGTGVWTYTGPGTATFVDDTDPNSEVSVDVLGLYTFTWTETNGICIDSDDLIVNFYEITVDVEVTNALCFGETNGTITINASGGVGSYVYSIYDETGPYDPSNVFNVTSGFYFIWVMDDNGCTAEYSGNPVFIDEPEKINFDYTVNNITTCFGANDGSIVINDVTGGTGNYEYSILEPAVWGTNPVFENLPGGPAIDYYIRVRDDSGCIVTGNNGNPITLDQPAEITFSTLPTNVTGCWYNTNGSIRVSNVIGGTGTKWVSINNTGVWFQIFNAGTIRTFTNLGVGDHTIRVRDRNNGPTACEVTRVITLTGPPPIVISTLDLTHNQCFGDATGIIDATATGGTGTLIYSLLFNSLPYAGPQATGLFENLAAGDYTLQVRDDNSCIFSQDITITSPDELIVETDITNISCSFAGNEGVISARASGGTDPYTILLFKGGIEQANFTGVLEGDWVDFTGLADASDYEVIVRDVNHPACNEATSGLLTVIVPAELVIDPLSILTQDITCNGASTGTITIAGLGGTLPYTYTLFDDLSNQVGDPIIANNTDPVQFIDVPAGTYTVEIDDANSCGPVASAPITLIEPNAIVIDPLSIAIKNITCFGANDGEITLTANGGTGDLYYTITQGGTPVVGFATQTNNGTFAPLEPGVYVIEITDDNSCGPILSAELTVVEPEALDINTIVTDAICNGETGSFDALASNGTPTYTYDLEDALSNPVETQTGDVDEWKTFSNLAPGDYTLYVTDFNGCNNSTIVTIGEPEVVDVSITFFDHPTCDASGNSTPGIITAEATGGSGTYTYSIYRNGIYQSDNSTGIFDALSSGDYYVEAYDSNGCGPATTATVTLNSPTDIEIDVINITNILCNGDLTGELEVIVINANGTPLYTITAGDDDWQTENTFTNLAAGDYTVRVKDDNNCVISQLVTISEPVLLEFTTVLTPPTTAVDTDGSIQVNVTGGTPNYWYELYIWDEGTVAWVLVDNADDLASTTHTFSGLGIGFYRIIVTDANGCSTFFDTPLSQFNITLSATDALCFESCDGTITVTPVGGAIQTITWEKDGVDFTTEMLANYDPINEVYNNICAGLYTAYATDTEGNNATAFIEVFEPTAITVDYLVDAPDCFTNLPEALVVFDILGGTPFADGYDITWDGGSARGFVAEDLAEGTYNFIISDANGCEFAVEEIDIVYPEGTTLSSLFVYDLTCNEDNSGGISMLVSGGTDPITYEIDGPSGPQQNNDGIFTGLEAGDYLLSITDANGCAHIFEESNTVQVAQPTAIEINQITSTIDPLNCHYDILEILGMEVTGGTPDYTYSWDNGQETVHLFDVSPGDYTLTVTDANGCQAVETVNVPGPEPLQLTYSIDIAKCRLAPEGNTGQISITNLTGGTGVFSNDFNLEWFLEGMGNIDRDNFWTIDQLQAGTYYAVITDQNACEDIIYFDVPYDEDNAFTVGIDMEDNYCFRDIAALTAIPIQGSFGSPAEFEWYNVTSNPDLIVGTSSNYTTPELTQNTRMLVRVISSMGCLEQRESTINVYPQIGPFLDRDDHSFFSDADTIAFRIDVGGGTTIGDTTVISVLADTEYPVEILTMNADYTLSYSWNPSEFFNPFNMKNSTMVFQSGTYESYFTGQMLNTLTQKNEQYIPIVGQVQSEFGCIETINLKARILDRINTSNVFSPNGDGINDIWGIPYSDLFPDLEIKIFNRWGAQVWSAKGSEASRGWNGKNKNGKDLPVATYYYVISFNVDGSSKWKPVSGSVTIVR